MSSFDLRQERFADILGYMAEEMSEDKVTYCLVMMLRGQDILQVAYTDKKHADVLDWINRSHGQNKFLGRDVGYAGNLSFEDNEIKRLLLADGGTSLIGYEKNESLKEMAVQQLRAVLLAIGTGVTLR